MPGFCGSTNSLLTLNDEFISSINLLDNLKTENIINEKYQLSAAYHGEHPLQGHRIYDDERWSLVFAGDLIDFDSIPYDFIIKVLESRNFSELCKLCSRWGFAAYDKEDDELFIATDRRSLQPVYYYIEQGSVVFSTDLVTFFNHSLKKTINKDFVYEYLFFGSSPNQVGRLA